MPPNIYDVQESDNPHKLPTSVKLLILYSKVLTVATLFLIFAGGMVTSTGSGLAVPDWPLSYGMFFPPMVGGVFYEHGHRMIAATVGFLTLVLAIWLGYAEQRRWVRKLGYIALMAVVLQGLLGGITVLFFLPTPVSVMHAVLAQTFFILTIMIAYSLSYERRGRSMEVSASSSTRFLKLTLLFIVCIYIQLILGALMRHTGSGLAIPDFPKMGGYWLPPFNDGMVSRINDWRFDMNLDPITGSQILIHFLHRLGACVITVFVILLNLEAFGKLKTNHRIVKTLLIVDAFIVLQIILGILTVLTHKAPVVTSFHVVIGAATLGLSMLLFVRSAPISWTRTKEIVLKK